MIPERNIASIKWNAAQVGKIHNRSRSSRRKRRFRMVEGEDVMKEIRTFIFIFVCIYRGFFA